jgi:hypothetical protein
MAVDHQGFGMNLSRIVHSIDSKVR